MKFMLLSLTCKPGWKMSALECKADIDDANLDVSF